MGQPDMNEILARAAQMQQQLQRAQEELIASEVTGQAGGGLVKITMSGSAELKDVVIDPKVVDPEDVETLQDLILGAYRDAHQQAGKLAEEKIGPFAQAGGDPLGGMFG